jgi:hypothetical protein
MIISSSSSSSSITLVEESYRPSEIGQSEQIRLAAGRCIDLII